jgi:hypothetical protein
MKPIRYVREEHFELVRGWLRSREQDIVPRALPENGFIVPGKAAGFLYRTDSSVAWIENIVAAPGLSREERNEAVDAVVAAIIERAKELGFELLVGYTLLDVVVKRAERFGFTHVDGGFHLVALTLRPPSLD